MKKLNITTILFCLILFITACGGSEDEVAIGDQVWTSKNLDVETYRNGDPIPQFQDNKAFLLIKTGAWCYYENKTANGTTYGKLYNWFAVNDPRGLAPKGYHIPSDAEWKILTDYLGGESVAGTKMKSTSGWQNKGNGSNTTGFAGLPGGTRMDTSWFQGAHGSWWSSSDAIMDIGSGRAWYRALYYDTDTVFRINADKRVFFSVRCLRD